MQEKKSKESHAVWTDIDKLRAKDLYFKGMPVTEISHVTGIGINTLKNWVYGIPDNEGKRYADESWKVERLAFYESIWAKAKELSVDRVSNVISNITEYIHRNLMEYLAENRKADPKELKLLSDVAANYDRIFRLMQGQPTEHILVEKLAEQPLEKLIVEMKTALVDFQRSDPMSVKTIEHANIETAVSSTDADTPGT